MIAAAVSTTALLFCPSATKADDTNTYGSFSTASNSTIVPFSFTLSGAANTSAGVFSGNGTLLRTLWSGVPYTAGTHNVAWDGAGDDGRLLPSGSYTIKVLSNNVRYNWDGVVGNTSDSFTGSTVWHQYSPIASFAFTGSTGYVASGYSEGVSSQSKFAVSDPQAKTWILQAVSSSQESWFVGTDGTTVYWAGDDPNSSGANNSFVFGTKASDDTEQSFSSGSSVPTVDGRTYASAFDIVNSANSLVTGFAVQQTGSFLFVARSGLNQIDVVNKTTGAVVTTNTTLTAPGQLAVDRENDLYVIHTSGGNRVVDKYTVNGSGVLSSAGMTVTGLLDPLAIAVAPDSSALVVADGSTSQQLKAFSTTTASSLWTYGTAGGYASNASVSTSKFYWNDARGTLPTFISFQTDGTFWVRDTGNDRILHFAADRSYLGQLMYIKHSYSAGVDRNDATRVFSDYKEFQIDYSKTLGPANGSWTLVNNWGGAVTSAFDDDNFRLKSVATLNNGHTYALLKHPASGNLQVAELVSGGALRMTGVETSGMGWDLSADGSLMSESCCNVGSSVTWKKRALTGFDGSNNPSWGSETTLATSPVTTANDPVYFGNGTGRLDQVTSSNVAVTFSNSPLPNGTNGYHLGGVAVGGSSWLWKVSPSTFTDYNGTFPTDGVFDIGNHINYAGSAAMVSGKNIIWGYYGENWKSNQTNEFEHFYDDGLFVGEFGTTAYGILFGGKSEAAAGVAGNSYSPALVTASDGNMYLYHNDESMHGGVHRWSISNLSSISEQSISVTLSPAVQGLLGQYFDSPQEDNAYLKTSRTDATVNFDWSGVVPSGTAISSATSYSVRWTGFVTPDHSENYTFYLKGNKGVRLWVDGNLLIDQWTNASLTEYSSSISLTAGTAYPIRVEYQNTSSNATAILQWSSSSRSKQVIPVDHMYPAPAPDASSGIDLLQGLPFDSSLTSGQYGWSRNPTTDITTDQFSNYWVVKSNDQTYVHGSPDVFARYRQNSATYTVTRDLGPSVSGLTSWDLSGYVGESFVAPNNDNGTAGGSYLEVLDASGKVITRFYQWASSGTNTRIQGNDRTIVDDTNSTVSQVTLYNDVPQPIDISLSGGTATFKYGPYNSVSTSNLVDPASDWKSPKTLRMYFLTTNANYDRMIDLQGMHFQAVGSGTVTVTVTVPTVTAQAASSVTGTSATLNGTITADGNASSTLRGFEYGLTTSYGSISSASGTFGLGSFSANVSGLTCNTTYHFRAFAQNSAGSASSTDASFTASACAATPPTLTTSAASSISASSMTLNANVSSLGSASVTQSGFAYGTNATLSSVLATTTLGAQGSGTFSGTISSLTPSTLYYMRAYATNSAGTSYGSIVSATTLSALSVSAPTVAVSAPSSISDTAATLSGAITADGNASSTVQGFEYGTSASYGGITSSSGLFNLGSFSANISSLSCATTYHVRSFATNSAGTASSTDLTFTTNSCPTSGGGGGGGGTVSSGGGGGGGGGTILPGPIAISNITVSGNTTSGVTILWNTNVQGTSQIQYGPTILYGQVTLIDPTFVTSHAEKLTSLVPNAVYHLQAKSKDVNGALATSTDLILVISSAGSVSLATPVSSVPALPVTGTPVVQTASLGSITAWLLLGSTDPQVKTLQQILNASGFTVAFSGIGSKGNESTYFGPATDAALKRFQCAKLAVCSGAAYTTGYGATGPKTRTALNVLAGSVSTAPVQIVPVVTTPAPAGSITAWLLLGTTNVQVATLQQILNAKGFTVSVSGTGSVGHESTYFGLATDAALKKFQCAKLAVCSGAAYTTGYGATGPKTRTTLNGN